jgi:hypothetical protein
MAAGLLAHLLGPEHDRCNYRARSSFYETEGPTLAVASAVWRCLFSTERKNSADNMRRRKHKKNVSSEKYSKHLVGTGETARSEIVKCTHILLRSSPV